MNHRPAEHRRPAPRRGLTLIELVVVMAILAALAGILIPTLSGMLTRAHASSSATNISELAKAIQTYHTQYLSYPDYFDSLVTDISAGTKPNYIKGGGDDLITVDLDDLVETLEHSGITGVRQMVEQGVNTSTGNFRWSPTFFPYDVPSGSATTPLITPLTDSSVLLGLTGAAAAREFAAPAGATYVVFGLGKYSTLSKSMLDAPVHFASEAEAAPALAYARYLVVFQLTDELSVGSGTYVPLERAKLVGIAALHHDSIVSVGGHLSEYYAAK